MYKIIIVFLILISNVFGGYIGKGGLYDYKFYFSSDKDGGKIYRIYCVEKNSMFSISKHKVFKNTNNQWYDMLFMDKPKYMGMTYDNLDVKKFGEKVCR